MGNRYEFQQVKTIVSITFDDIRIKCEKIGLSREHMLDIYPRSCIQEVGCENDYFLGMSLPVNTKSDFFGLEEKLSEIINLMTRIPPVQFLQQYEAYYYKEDNITGLENGLAFERFLRQDNDLHLLIVDPNPYLVASLFTLNKKQKEKTILAFTDSRYRKIYEQAKILKPIAIKDFSKLHRLMKSNDYASL